MTPPRSYREAGVDMESAREFIRQIQPLARRTRRQGLVRGIGGFGGLFQMNGSFGKRPILVASADGVGTKLLLAQRAYRENWQGRGLRWVRPLGVDLVAMNVNDILCTGAEPLLFLDYIAAGKLDAKVLLAVVQGMAAGCSESGCVLLGGETAQMGLLYGPGDFDLAGFAVGVVEKKSLVTGERIRPGDQVVGIASSGVHSNGFSLVQKVLSLSAQKRWAGQLLQPTRIYVRPVLDVLRRRIPVYGLAHITGGSFAEKIPRILPSGVGVELWKGSWPVPSIFRQIQATGVPEQEMYRTFNMGVGMVLVLPSKVVTRTRQILKRRRVVNWLIGEVTRGNRKVRIG